uniref:Interleukin-12 subunit alpha n=1 Tax=Zeugodacus cucurbitae TaxID=28588 RepID=A0A0A1XRJ0_ZEUCU
MLKEKLPLNRQQCLERIQMLGRAKNPVEAPAKILKNSRITVKCCKSVSPEFRSILKSYEMPSGPLEPLKITKRKPKQLEPEPAKDLNIDEMDPAMARYMRMVMEANSIQNSLYDINFYASERAKKNAGNKVN